MLYFLTINSLTFSLELTGFSDHHVLLPHIDACSPRRSLANWKQKPPLPAQLQSTAARTQAHRIQFLSWSSRNQMEEWDDALCTYSTGCLRPKGPSLENAEVVPKRIGPALWRGVTYSSESASSSSFFPHHSFNSQFYRFKSPFLIFFFLFCIYFDSFSNINVYYSKKKMSMVSTWFFIMQMNF